MSQQNKRQSNGNYTEMSALYGNLYATGYAIGESEAKSALNRFAASLSRLVGRKVSNQQRCETAAAPARRKATAKA